MLKLQPDEAALLRAICTDRDNDLPRLVYADWLDDAGRPERAEFIRLQCQSSAAGFSGSPTTLEHGDVGQGRITTLWRTHRTGWLRELPKWAVNDHVGDFVRGFVGAFALPAASFVRYGPQLLDRTPVDWLALRAAASVLGELVVCPWLREVPTVYLAGNPLGDAGAAALCSAPWLVGTRRLLLNGCDLGDPAARTLAGCRHLAGLELLNLGGNRLTPVGLEHLLASPHLERCQFQLGGNPRLLADPHATRRLLGPRGTL